MIPKIICFIFGHIRTYKGDVRPTGMNAFSYVYKTCWFSSCPRCGTKLIMQEAVKVK